MVATTRLQRLLPLALLVAGAPALAAPQEEKPPSKREQEKLVERYFELDGRTDEGHAEHLEILARLELVPPLSAKEVEKWKKELFKLQARGPRLDRGSGRQWFEEKPEKRGLFIVGGNTKRPKGLFIGMHGGGLGSGEATSASATWGAAVAEMDWVGIFPEVLEKTEHGWTTSGTEEWVMELIDRARRTWKIDPDKIFFGGHSMGGFGTWTLGAHHADRVAGLTPSAGAPTPLVMDGKVVGIDDGVIPNLRNVRLCIYQSDDDVQVPPDANRAAAELLGEARERWGGFDYEYWEESGRGHDVPPGGVVSLLEKVADAVRDPRPARVVWQPTLIWKRHFYWLYWEEPAIGALVEADLDAENNRVRVSCDRDAAGLGVLLDDELLDLEREVTVLLGEEVVFQGLVERRLSTLVMTSARNDPGLAFTALVPLVPGGE